MNKHKRWFFISIIFFALGLISIFSIKALRYPSQPGPGRDTTPIVINIKSGSAFSQVVDLLEQKGLIDHPRLFSFYARQRDVQQSIKAGAYTLHAQMSAKEIIDKLIAVNPHRIVRVTLTIPEGKNSVEIQKILAETGLCTETEVSQWMKDKKFLESLGLGETGIEGYLFPETYFFPLGRITCVKVIEELVKQTKIVLAELKSKDPERFEELLNTYKFGEREILTFASLVEKETAQKYERPIIAAVFYRRLSSAFPSHLLQTDPTITYGCTVGGSLSKPCRVKGKITRAQLDDKENPYNTYTHPGLPPGPIANPGKAALEAVLHPEMDGPPFLYFVARADKSKSHDFSVRYEDHLQKAQLRRAWGKETSQSID